MVDFDDYWYLPTNHLSFDHYKRSNQSKKFIEILKLANYVSITTPLLANEVKKYNSNVFIFPNVLNPKDRHSQPIEMESEKLRFGYIGGSCHLPDIELLRGLNNKLTNAGLQYSLNLFGYKHNSVYFDYASVLTDNANYTDNLTLYPSLPVPDYLLFYNMIDVSLIPLVCNKFNSLKSELKLVEAGIFRKAIISSNVEPYQPYLKDKINCLITNSRTDWFKKMKYLVNNRELANDIGIQLHNDIQKHFNYEKISNYRTEVYKDIIQKG
jgi:glycosyltransferase involved in cell wall biosynthesis